MIDIRVFDELVAAKLRAEDMAEAYADTLKAAAEAAGIDPAVLRKAVSARVSGKAVAVIEAAEQLVEILSIDLGEAA